MAPIDVRSDSIPRLFQDAANRDNKLKNDEEWGDNIEADLTVKGIVAKEFPLDFKKEIPGPFEGGSEFYRRVLNLYVECRLMPGCWAFLRYESNGKTDVSFWCIIP